MQRPRELLPHVQNPWVAPELLARPTLQKVFHAVSSCIAWMMPPCVPCPTKSMPSPDPAQGREAGAASQETRRQGQGCR